MNPFTIQTLFLLYSALSFLSAILIATLFWNKKDASARFWLIGCLLTSIATCVTVFRGDIPLVLSFSFMVFIEATSILLFSESLKRLSGNHLKHRFNWYAFIIPIALFVTVEIQRFFNGGLVTPGISATATFIFGVANLFCLYQAKNIGKEFTNRVFFNFFAIAFTLIITLYWLRVLIVGIGYGGYTFAFETYNIVLWFLIILFGSIRNLAYIVLRLHLGFTEHGRLNNMNLKLSNILDERNAIIMSLEKLNKSVSINALASTIAHEINQPLGASKLNAQFVDMKLTSEPGNTSLLKEVIQNILYDIDRAATIVKNLSRLSQNNQSPTLEVNLLESLEEVAEISKNKLRNSKINLEINCPPNHFIKINLGEWQQVLINLINNAIEALDNKMSSDKKLMIFSKEFNDRIEIAIEDNGPGIPSGQESKIFDLMFTSKEAGTGIGLWLSRNIIGRFGGELSVENVPSGGARFTIKLSKN
jgi:signal transduction histidine kinase